MKRTFKVTATGSSMCGGRIATVSTLVEFDIDKDSIKEFYDSARHGIFLRGYNILHWGAINGVEDGKCLFVVMDNERMCRRILRDCADYEWAADRLKVIKDAENGKVAEGVKEYKGMWICQGGWSRDSLERMMRKAESRISVTSLVLDELGYDPNDRDGIRRVCRNMGIDAYPGNGTC